MMAQPTTWAVWFGWCASDSLEHCFTGTWDECIAWARDAFIYRLAEERHPKNGCPDCAQHCVRSLEVLSANKNEHAPLMEEDLQVEGDDLYIFPVPATRP